MASGTKDVVYKRELTDPVPVGSIPVALGSAGTAVPYNITFSMQGSSSLIFQANYTYGAATGLRFDFVEIDADFPAGSQVTSLDIIGRTIQPFYAIYNYPTLANGSVRIVFPISGNTVKMTITAQGSPTASDTLTKVTMREAVFI